MSTRLLTEIIADRFRPAGHATSPRRALESGWAANSGWMSR